LRVRNPAQRFEITPLTREFLNAIVTENLLVMNEGLKPNVR
jgi:hypothetical protein